MHDEGIPKDAKLTVAEIERQSDRVVLMILTSHPGLWSLDEIKREVHDPQDVEDSVNRLHAAGLVHKIDGFAFASRAATLAVELEK